MAHGGLSGAAMQEWQHQNNQHPAEVREEKMWEDGFPTHQNVKVAMVRHLAMLHEDQTDGCLPCQHGTALNLQTYWRRRGMGVLPADSLSQLTPNQMQNVPGTPLVPPCENEGVLVSKIKGVLPGYVYSDTLLPGAREFNLVPYAMGSKSDTDFDPHLRTTERSTTG